MNAQIPTAVIQQNIALDLLFPSPTNPRKRFDEAKLKELAASIETQGVLQPILVRTWQVGMQLPAGKVFGDMVGAYEVIAGERRYRASKLAGLIEVPCFVRELTNLQVLHAQVIENLQRDDLHPIEEAEGYEKLMEQTDENGDKFTADTIAAEVGKSRAYVYGRLKLLDLCQEARDAFFKGELDASTALLIARIPTQLLQIEALGDIAKDSMSYRAAKDYIQRRFMLDLATAPFEIKDAKLLEKAGACTACIKRTGNQPELFDDVKSKDVCTDTACFAEKKTAHIADAIKKAEANGDEVIRKEAAAKLIHYPGDYYIRWGLRDAGLTLLDEEIPDDAAERTWEDALETHGLLSGKKAMRKTFIENPFEEGVIVAINPEAAMEALTKAGFEIKVDEEKTSKAQSNSKTIADNAKKQAEEAARIDAEVAQQNAFRQSLFDTLRQQIAGGNVPEGLYRILASEFLYTICGSPEDAEIVIKHYAPDTTFDDDNELRPEIDTHLAKLNPQQLFLLMIDCVMLDEKQTNRWNLEDAPVRMLAIAKEIGVDTEAVMQEATAANKKTTKPKKGAAA